MNATNVSITVNYTANPPVSSYGWMFNGKKLSESNLIKFNSTSITFTPILAYSNMGSYMLNLINSQGEVNTSFNVDIYCKYND